MFANTIAAVIFDLDGLLADTECLHCRAYQMALLEHGVQLQDCDYAEHWVRYGRGIADWVAMRGLELDPDALRLRKAQHYLDLLASSLRPMEGALDLLEFLRGRTKLALASSSYRDAIDGVLAGLGIRHFFQVIVSGLDVAHVKPAPDIFLKAARDLDSCRCHAVGGMAPYYILYPPSPYFERGGGFFSCTGAAVASGAGVRAPRPALEAAQCGAG